MRLKTTRQQILDLIAAKEITCVEEISRILHLTAANARHHLGILCDEGLVVISGTRPSGRRGRPVQLFQLTQPRLEHNLDVLSHLLLTFMKTTQNPEDSQKFISNLTDQLIYTKFTQKRESGSPTLSQTLSHSVRLLNSLHYRSRWEAHTQGPRIILGHCPYWSIVEQHPELCQMDKILIEKLLGVSVRQSAKLEVNSQGVPICTFQAILNRQV